MSPCFKKAINLSLIGKVPFETVLTPDKKRALATGDLMPKHTAGLEYMRYNKSYLSLIGETLKTDENANQLNSLETSWSNRRSKFSLWPVWRRRSSHFGWTQFSLDSASLKSLGSVWDRKARLTHILQRKEQVRGGSVVLPNIWFFKYYKVFSNLLARHFLENLFYLQSFQELCCLELDYLLKP